MASGSGSVLKVICSSSLWEVRCVDQEVDVKIDWTRLRIAARDDVAVRPARATVNRRRVPLRVVVPGDLVTRAVARHVWHVVSMVALCIGLEGRSGRGGVVALHRADCVARGAADSRRLTLACVLIPSGSVADASQKSPAIVG